MCLAEHYLSFFIGGDSGGIVTQFSDLEVNDTSSILQKLLYIPKTICLVSMVINISQILIGI